MYHWVAQKAAWTADSWADDLVGLKVVLLAAAMVALTAEMMAAAKVGRSAAWKVEKMVVRLGHC